MPARTRLKYAIETFNVTSGKQILAEKPGDFQTFAVFGDFAAKMKTRGARRAHAQSRGKIRQRNVRHGMVLQSKAHFENRIVSGCRFSPRARTSSTKGWRWQTSRSLADAPLADDRRNARAIDLPAQRYNTRVVSHRFARGLLGAIGHRRADDEISYPLHSENAIWKAPSSVLKNVTPVRRASSRVSLVKFAGIAESHRSGGPGVIGELHIRRESRRTWFSKNRRAAPVPPVARKRARLRPTRCRFAAPAASASDDPITPSM